MLYWLMNLGFAAGSAAAPAPPVVQLRPSRWRRIIVIRSR